MANLQIAPLDSLDSFQTQKKKKQALLKETVSQRANEHGVLLVRMDNIPAANGSALTERQRRWLDSAPYDSITQNPVLYKYAKESCRLPKGVIEKEEACSAVKSLTDNVIASPPSGIGEKIIKRRRERHQQLVTDMEEELSVICLELESRVKQVSDEVCSQLESNDNFIAELFSEVNPDEALQKLKMINLERLWTKVASQSPIREEFIKKLDTSLQEVETDRTCLIEKVLCDYVDKFNRVAFILPEDVGRFIEAQGIFMNTAIISNRRNYVELCTHLRTMDCDREKQHHKKWLSLVEEWRHLLYKSALTSFIQFVENDTKIIAVTEMNRLNEELTLDQKRAGSKRKELMDYILNLKPPKICPPLIYEWRENADKLYEDLDGIHSSFLLKTQQCLDTAHRACEDEMDRLRKRMTSSGAYDSYTAYEMMCIDFLPLIDHSSKKMREDLQSLERGLDSVITIQKEQFSEVFQFVQEAALLWTNQQSAIGLAHKKYEECLEKSRALHDKSNQNLEANLDVVLDRLRQGHSEAVLKQYRNEALRMLETIRCSYSSFRDRTINEAKKLPFSLEPDLNFYDNAICHQLGVVRQAVSLSAKSRTSSMAIPKPKTAKKKPSKASMTSMPWNAPKIVINVQHTPDDKRSEEDGGEETVTFFILHEGEEVKRKTSSPKRKKSDSIFMTQDEGDLDAESSHVIIATENVVLAGGAFTQVIQGIRVNFLDHLEFWKRKCIKIANQIVAEKEEASMTELDLRLHLHKPRPSRITEDIFNVRVAELSVHGERINRHAKGVVVSIEEHRDTIKDLTQKLSAESEALLSSLSALKFTSVHNGRQLAKLKSEGEEIIERHVTASEDTISEYKSDSNSQLQQLVDSTENYKSSLKLFQEGGNYCPEEIEDFSKKIDRIIGKVSSTKATIAKEVTSLSKTHQQTIHDAGNTFTRIFGIYQADIVFSETMSQALVSVQVSIKSEVAASNLKAKQIFADIEKIQKQISEAIEKKSLFGSFQPELTKLCSLLTKRAEYLYCCDSMFKPEDETKALSPSPIPGRVSFGEEMADSHKPQNPLSVLNITKNIMENTSAGATPSATPKRRQSIGIDNNEHPKVEHSHSKELHSKIERSHSKEKELHFKVPTTGGSGDGRSAWTTVPTNSPSTLTPAAGSSKSRRHSLAAAVDRKDFTSSLGGSGGYKLSSFMPKIRSILKAKYNELFDVIDEYYSKRQMQGKDSDGTPVHHLHSLKETPEGCILAIEEKLNAYRTQAEEYRRDCIEEFQGQVKLLVPTLQEFIIMSSQEFRDKQQDSAKEAWQQDRRGLLEELEKNYQDKKTHESSLQPALGRPDKEVELASLCSREEERHIKALRLITEHSQNMTERLKKVTFNILSEISKITKNSLHLVDGFIFPSEITDFKVKVKTEIEDLLRQQMADLFPTKRHSRASIGNIKAKKIKFKAITNRSMQWPNLPQNHKLTVLMPVKKARVNAMCDLLKEKPVSKKATVVHDEVIRTRDLVFEELMTVNADIMEEMKKLEEAEKEAEQRWITNWRTSVENVKDLYKL